MEEEIMELLELYDINERDRQVLANQLNKLLMLAVMMSADKKFYEVETKFESV